MRDEAISPNHGESAPWVRVLRLGWPISLQAMATASFGLLDVAMVQRLGPEAVAAVGLAGRGLFVLTMVLAGLTQGAAVLLAQHAARGEVTPAARLLRWVALAALAITLPLCALALAAPQAVAAALVADPAVAAPLAAFVHAVALSVPLSALTAALTAVARCHGDSRSPMLAALAGLAVNAVLNAVLIFGLAGAPALGVAGAGWATSAARALELGLLVAAMTQPANPARAVLAALGDRQWRSPGLLTLAAPFMLQELVWSGSGLAYGLVFAAIGAPTLALASVVAPAEGLMITLFVGGAVACGIVVGGLLGQGRFDAARALARRALWRFGLAALPVCALGAAATALALEGLPWLAGDRGAVWAVAGFAALGVAARVVAMTLVLGVLRAGGDRGGVLAVELVGTVGVGVPLVAAAGLWWGVDLAGLYALLAALETAKAAALAWRMRTGPWCRSLLGAPEGADAVDYSGRSRSGSPPGGWAMGANAMRAAPLPSASCQRD